MIFQFAAEARRTLDEERPGTKLGIYSCPWTDEEHDGGLRRIVAEDIDRLHGVLDVFSPMVYQVKCGRPTEWVGEYTRWLVDRVAALNARRGRKVEVWPIVEAHGATGVSFFALPHVAADAEKLAAVRRVYRSAR